MRQWVVSVPIPLRYWMASSRDLTAQVHRIVRTTIAQYYGNQAVSRGAERHKVHFHIVFLEGVYLDRTEQDLKSRFIKLRSDSASPLANGRVKRYGELAMVLAMKGQQSCPLPTQWQKKARGLNSKACA